VADVICFPLHRRASLVKETTHLVHLKSPDAAARFWRATVRRLRVEFATHGIPEMEASLQLHAFAHAVLGPAQNPTFGDDAA